MVAESTAPGVVAAQRAMMKRPDSTPLLSAIHVPTVVIHGLDDRIVSEEEAHAMASSIDGAKFIGVRRAGHLPNLERPERVNDALRCLISAVSDGRR